MSFINALLSLLLFTGISTGNVSQPAELPKTAPTPVSGSFMIKELKPDCPECGYPWMESGLDSRHVKKAYIETSTYNQKSFVMVEFNYAGTELLAEITARNIGRQVGVFVGDELITAPTVNEAITGGVVQITGQFTLEQATDLANQINSGISPTD